MGFISLINKITGLDYKYEAHEIREKKKKMVALSLPFASGLNHFELYIGVKTCVCKWSYFHTIFTPYIKHQV